MISCDTNILFASLDADSSHHESATGFLKSMMHSDRFGLSELVLVELYGLLRNPTVARDPYTAAGAAQVVSQFRAHPRWALLDYPGPQVKIMDNLWSLAGRADFPYKRIYDARLALTLRHHGVTEFATRNIRDFQAFGFKRVWDPVAG